MTLTFGEFFVLLIYYFTVGKYAQHKISHCDHLEVSRSVAVSPFTRLGCHHLLPSPELSRSSLQKLCTH